LIASERFGKIVVVGGLFFISKILLGSAAMAYEEPKFTLVKKEGNFELRRYEEHIVAEAIVEGDFKEAGGKGFRLLFNYISGNNRSRQKVKMTAPVSQETVSEKIEMTVPVSLERTGEKWSITFLMPSRFTLETLPEPLEPNVRLRRVPPRLVAVLRYSGTWSERRYEDKKRELIDLLNRYGFKPIGNPILARYNSPFSLWFLRRNEVIIEVEQDSK
jgi:hypothetical protein